MLATLYEYLYQPCSAPRVFPHVPVLGSLLVNEKSGRNITHSSNISGPLWTFFKVMRVFLLVGFFNCLLRSTVSCAAFFKYRDLFSSGFPPSFPSLFLLGPTVAVVFTRHPSYPPLLPPGLLSSPGVSGVLSLSLAVEIETVFPLGKGIDWIPSDSRLDPHLEFLVFLLGLMDPVSTIFAATPWSKPHFLTI